MKHVGKFCVIVTKLVSLRIKIRTFLKLGTFLLYYITLYLFINELTPFLFYRFISITFFFLCVNKMLMRSKTTPKISHFLHFISTILIAQDYLFALFGVD